MIGVYCIMRVVFLARYRNVMICAVHRGPHKISHICIKTDMLFIDILDVQHAGYQIAVGTCDESTAFHEES